MVAQKVVPGVYEDGEVRLALPVDIEGRWKVEITFVERDEVPLEVSPHRPERAPLPDRLEELHRNVVDSRPHTGPF